MLSQPKLNTLSTLVPFHSASLWTLAKVRCVAPLCQTPRRMQIVLRNVQTSIYMVERSVAEDNTVSRPTIERTIILSMSGCSSLHVEGKPTNEHDARMAPALVCCPQILALLHLHLLCNKVRLRSSRVRPCPLWISYNTSSYALPHRCSTVLCLDSPTSTLRPRRKQLPA